MGESCCSICGTCTSVSLPTYTSGDIERLLDACEEGDEAKPHLRNRAIVTVLVDAACGVVRLSV